MPDGGRRKEETNKSGNTPLKYQQLLRSMKEVYGANVSKPSAKDVHLYRRYASMASSAAPSQSKETSKTYKRLMIPQKSAFTVDNTLQVTTPYVAKSSLDVYIGYFMKGKSGKVVPAPKDSSLYRQYASR